MNWFHEHSGTILFFVLTFLGLLVLVGLGVLGMIWIGRGLKRLADTQLSIDKVKQEQSVVRAATKSDQIAPMRADIRDLETRLKEANALAKAREKLLAAQDENLAARAKALATMEKELGQANRKAHDAEQRAKDSAAALAKATAELEHLRTAHAQVEQAAGMMQRQMEGMQQNAAMLQTTVADLNAKRDLLSAEVRHLQERLEQEMALRGR